MSLTVYKKKRNFSQTPEPEGKKAAPHAALSFVIQRHDASRLHYDFRLEMDGVLKSWAVPKGPSLVAGEKHLAVHVEDHPLPYGKFYGVIPEGNYGAGTVDIWDHGTYTPLEKVPVKDREKHLLAQLRKGDLKFVLNGKHLKGAFALVRMKGTEDDGKNWLLIKKSDEHALKKYDISKVEPVKVHKNKTWTPAKKSTKAASAKPAKKAATPAKRTAKAKPAMTEALWHKLSKPMLASLSADMIDNPGFYYEVKYDGYRALTRIGKKEVDMRSRNGNSFNQVYGPLIAELEKVHDEAVIDGEVVIENEDGVSDFQLLQNFTSTRKGTLKYYVFDLLYLNGHDVTDLTLAQRKELLASFFEKYRFKHIHLSEVKVGKGEQLFRRLSAKGHEGVIVKDPGSTYLPGKRSASWLKIKGHKVQEVVICGYTLPQKSRKYIGSLVLGVYDGDELRYIGNCGTGFTEVSLKELHKKLSKLETIASPFAEKVVMTGAKGQPVWVKPELVCQVKFLEWTNDNRLRNPVFMGLRTDKKAAEVAREYSLEEAGKAVRKKAPAGRASSGKAVAVAKDQEIKVGAHRVKCTNPGKEYWPGEGITKGDLITYYLDMSAYILPYLRQRPQSLNRHPNGIKAPGFFQKDMEVKQLPAWVRTEKMYSKSNKKYIDYLVCNDAATLVYMANLGCIEINPWHSRYNQPDHPDYLILDLDPGKIAFKEVVKTALTIKEICDELDVPCFCKTSGATGLHVYIPLKAKYDYDKVKTFAELMAMLTHKRLPRTTSIERSVARRPDKIYVDFLQNRKGQTVAAPYSVRPKPGATVSTPLLWEEVNEKLDPKAFTIFTTAARIKQKGDLWKGVLGKGVNLDKVLKKMAALAQDV